MKKLFERSELYETLEEFFGDAITKKSLRFDLLIMILIFISALVFVLEASLMQYPTLLSILGVIDLVLLIIFTIEILLRFYMARSKKKFFLSAYSWIDILAVVPFWFGFSSQTIRMFRLFRVFRFLRFLNISKQYMEQDKELDFSLEKLFVFRIFFTVFMLMFVSAALIFQVEFAYNAMINSFWDAFYFVLISVTTVGYGDIVPVTTFGRILIMISIVSFLVIIPVHITAMTRYLSNEKKILRISCKKCGLKRHQTDSRHCRNCGALLGHV
jgi:voltage-gated potassium channel